MNNFRKLVKKLVPTNLFKKIEPYGHLIEAVIANIRYGFPSRKMQVIGVTGTNGKTTTTFLIQRMLHEAGFKTALLSTVAYGLGDDIKPQIEHMTTTDAFTLQKRLRDFKRAGVEWVIIETSSHSLAQNRVWGIPFQIAVMTNVTNDHLDYHGTFRNYLQAKVRLFKIAARHGQKFGVINADDENAKLFEEAIPNFVSYGIKGGDLKATTIKPTAVNTNYQAMIDNEKYDITVNIPGDFNVSNSLAAVAVGRKIDLSVKQIEQGIASLEGVEGRMTVVDEGQDFQAIVDFASTPDAFEKLFESLRPVVKGKLVAVFGSAGRRDEAKRAVQGEIAGRFADEVVITEEDDRDVDGKAIMQQIAEGAIKAGKKINENMFLVHDRTEAINFAVNRVKEKDDAVVFLGKGHEKTIERADGVHEWREIETVRQALCKLK